MAEVGKGTSPVAGTRAGARPIIAMRQAGWAGQWYWMRSPDQEQRVVMALYNRYCIRCHGIDGRGVWDIPDVPDFTDKRWQASRPDPQIVNIVMEGRGACMPMFRGTLGALMRRGGMAPLPPFRIFVPGTEVPRPEVGSRCRTRIPIRTAKEALPLAPGRRPVSQATELSRFWSGSGVWLRLNRFSRQNGNPATRVFGKNSQSAKFYRIRWIGSNR